MYSYIVVDDEPTIRKGLIAKLGQVDNLPVSCVGEASGGRQALELMVEKTPDILITDMRMSDMHGVELLERMYLQYPDVPVIVISGYKLFDYVKHAIEKRAVGYVLKPFSTQEITQQVEKAIDRLEKRSQIQWLRHEAAELEKKRKRDALTNALMRSWSPEIGRVLSEAGYPVYDEYLLITVLAQPLPALSQLEQLYADAGIGPSATFVENPLDSHQCLILLHGAPASAQRGAAERLAHYIECHVEVTKLVFFISGDFGSLQQLNTRRLENEAALQAVIPALSTQIIQADAIIASSRSPYSDEEVDNFFREMRTRNQKVGDIMSKFFEVFDPQHTTWGEIAAACGLLLEKVNDYARQNQAVHRDLMENFLAHGAPERSLAGVQKTFAAYIQGVLSAVRLKKNNQQQLFDQINEYLHNNYRKKVTLQTLASKFYVSSAYCSNLLREALDMSFNDYLGQIRIEKAKQLLQATNLSAKEISAEVGYPNPKYFFKVFRVATGTTPLEYREQNSDQCKR